jgi:hypothetical protein
MTVDRRSKENPIFLPLGFTSFMFSFQLLDGWKLWVCIIVSVVVMTFGYIGIRSSIKWARIEDAESNEKFNILINEIRLLRRDINNGGSQNVENQSNPTESKHAYSDKPRKHNKH